jgi:hypothetical protein
MTAPEPTAVGVWDRPCWTIDGEVYDVCPRCDDGGPHPAEERDGLTVMTCRLDGNVWAFGA